MRDWLKRIFGGAVRKEGVAKVWPGSTTEESYSNAMVDLLPGLLRQIARRTPSAIVFVDSSARPHAWVASRVWERLNLGKKPRFIFLAPPRLSDSAFTDYSFKHGKYGYKLDREVSFDKFVNHQAGAFNLAVAKLVQKEGLKGKRVVVFEDRVASGRNMNMIAQALEKAGVTIITAAFYDGARRAKLRATEQGRGLSAPWGRVGDHGLMVRSECGPRVSGIRDKERFLQVKRLAGEVAQRIIEGRRLQ